MGSARDGDCGTEAVRRAVIGIRITDVGASAVGRRTHHQDAVDIDVYPDRCRDARIDCPAVHDERTQRGLGDVERPDRVSIRTNDARAGDRCRRRGTSATNFYAELERHATFDGHGECETLPVTVTRDCLRHRGGAAIEAASDGRGQDARRIHQ